MRRHVVLISSLRLMRGNGNFKNEPGFGASGVPLLEIGITCDEWPPLLEIRTAFYERPLFTHFHI
jgi:hypothetical protein